MSPGRDQNLAEAFRQACIPTQPPLSYSCALIWLWLIEIGGESDTQPHSRSRASGPQIVIKFTVKIFRAGWEAVMQGTWWDSGAVICSSGLAALSAWRCDNSIGAVLPPQARAGSRHTVQPPGSQMDL